MVMPVVMEVNQNRRPHHKNDTDKKGKKPANKQNQKNQGKAKKAKNQGKKTDDGQATKSAD